MFKRALARVFVLRAIRATAEARDEKTVVAFARALRLLMKS